MSLQPLIIEKGIIQPSFNKRKRFFRTSFIRAGVLTNDGRPIRQSKTIIMEQDILSPYRINPSETEIKYIDEDVIYFSRPQNHFGHTLVGTMSVAYILLNSNYRNHKIVFIDEEPCEPAVILLEHLGVDRKNIITINSYTQFKSVVVVKQSFVARWLPRNGRGPYKGSKEFIDTFQAIAQKFRINTSNPCPRKIYFSRRKLGSQAVMGEDKIENVFRENGYEVFYPETLSLDEQIKLVANADHYVCIQGSLEHHSLFMKEGATLVVLKREKNPTFRQTLINKLQPTIKHIYLQVNVRPLGENGSRYIIGATESLLLFFDENQFVFNAEKLTPTYEELVTYISFNLSCNRKRALNTTKKRLRKLISHHKDYWKQIK